MSRNNPCGHASPSPDSFACETTVFRRSRHLPLRVAGQLYLARIWRSCTWAVCMAAGERRVHVGNAKVATEQVPIGIHPMPLDNGSDTVLARLSDGVLFLLCSVHVGNSSTRRQTFLRGCWELPSVPLEMWRAAQDSGKINTFSGFP